LKFFFDNNLSPYYARAIATLASPEGHLVRHLKESFDPATPDIEWIKKLAEETGWVIISGDLRISRNALEREAWKQARLTTFFLAKAWSHHAFWDQAWRLIRWWPYITKQAGLVDPGAAFEVSANFSGKFKQLK